MPRRYFWDYKVSTLDYSHYHQHKTDHLQVIYVCHICKLWEWETSVVKITYPPGGVKEKNTLLGTILGKKRMLASFIDVNLKVGIFNKTIFFMNLSAWMWEIFTIFYHKRFVSVHKSKVKRDVNVFG